MLTKIKIGIFSFCVLSVFSSQILLAEEAKPANATQDCSLENQAQCLAKANSLFDEERYEASLVLYEPLCSANVPSACHRVGWLYESGYDENATIEGTLNVYRKGCGLNYAKSCHNLAVAYEFWQGVDVPVAKVIEAYAKGCELKFHDSCSNLAINYGDGDGVDQSTDKYIELNKKACALKGILGCKALGDYYDDQGEMTLSLKYHLISCELGLAYGCQQAGWKYGYEIEGKKDYAKYLKYSRMACDMGDGAACRNAGRVLMGYSEAREAGSPLDKTTGLSMLLKSCREIGFAPGCADAATAYEKGHGVEVDLVKSKKLYIEGCDEFEDFSAYSCYSLGYEYKYGNDVIKKDRKKAKHYLNKACDAGREDACELL